MFSIYFLIKIPLLFFRLSGERQRINQVIPKGSIVCDVMAGVGAFSMHLAKRGCYVLANDYNKRATECIQINTNKNKVQQINNLHI
jgi:tRNA (guanine37-N1)-methyltransferase